MNDNYDWDGASKYHTLYCRRVINLLITPNFIVGSALAEVATGHASNKDFFWQLSEVAKAGIFQLATIKRESLSPNCVRINNGLENLQS